MSLIVKMNGMNRIMMTWKMINYCLKVILMMTLITVRKLVNLELLINTQISISSNKGLNIVYHCLIKMPKN